MPVRYCSHRRSRRRHRRTVMVTVWPPDVAALWFLPQVLLSSSRPGHSGESSYVDDYLAVPPMPPLVGGTERGAVASATAVARQRSLLGRPTSRRAGPCNWCCCRQAARATQLRVPTPVPIGRCRRRFHLSAVAVAVRPPSDVTENLVATGAAEGVAGKTDRALRHRRRGQLSRRRWEFFHAPHTYGPRLRRHHRCRRSLLFRTLEQRRCRHSVDAAAV